MDYEKKYNEALELARVAAFNGHQSLMEGIFPELKESEDEKVRKELITHCRNTRCVTEEGAERIAKRIAWLEKQCEQKSADKVEPKFKVGDKVKMKEFESFPHICTVENIDSDVYYCDFTNFDINDQNGWELVKEPKFKVGDWIVDNCNNLWKIVGIMNGFYILEDGDEGCSRPTIEWVDKTCHLWTIQDAKDGDVLSDGTTIFIFKDLLSDGSVMSYCDYDTDSGESDAFCPLSVNLICSKITPATKAQRDLLFQKMKESGYEWDEEKKELKKIEDEEYDGKDYGIDGLWHAMNILEKTLGKVNGYQTDDGFLSHQCAITAVKKLYKQKPTETAKWSAQEEYCICELEAMVREAWRKAENVRNDITIKKMQELMFFLKTLNSNKKPQRIISAEAKEALYDKPAWSEEDEGFLDSALWHIQNSITNGKIKAFVECPLSTWLKSLKDRVQPKQEWNEEDERIILAISQLLKDCESENGWNCVYFNDREVFFADIENYLQSFKNRIASQPKQEWSEEDNETLDRIISNYQYFCDELFFKEELTEVEKQAMKNVDKEDINWLKSLKDKYTWKPSEEQIKAVKRASNGSRAIAGNDYLIMESLYNDLKKLKEE